MMEPLKKIAFLVPRPGMSNDDFLRHWQFVHGPLVAGSPGYARWRLRYVQNHVRGPGPVGQRFGFAGMAEFLLPGRSPNEDAFAQTSTYRDHIAPDERNFIDMERTVSMAAHEDTVLPGRAPAKVVVLSSRAKGVAADELHRRYRTEVVAKALALPGFAGRVRGWCVNHVIEGSFRLPGGRAVDWLTVDLVEELWFASTDEMVQAFESAPLACALLHGESRQSFVAQEHVFFDEGNVVASRAGDLSG